MDRRFVFVTGGTGYLGRPLIGRLIERGHDVRALVRPGSEHKLPHGAHAVMGNALVSESFASQIAPADILVHLVGTPHPNPSKAREFRAVDLVSIQASVRAAREAGVRNIVYVSVAQPAPVMRAYVEVRQEGEALVRASGIPTTILRPWYILGPRHRWPYFLKPLYAVLEMLPRTRETARRLGLVSLRQMLAALENAVENAPVTVKIVEVPEIRSWRYPWTSRAS
jgi:uncharacterized protein YbjT (DUF2867 family)